MPSKRTPEDLHRSQLLERLAVAREPVDVNLAAGIALNTMNGVDEA